MCTNASTFLGIEQLPQFPQLQKWLGLAAVGSVELGHIVDPPVIHTATSIVPLGWCGLPADKNSQSLKVDITGRGLHLCTLVQAQVDGNWYSSFIHYMPLHFDDYKSCCFLIIMKTYIKIHISLCILADNDEYI